MTEVARWRLTGPHYLNGYFPEADNGKTEWEYQEVSTTGRAVRKRHVVPMYLDPKDAATFNYPGEIIVSNGPHAADIVFFGAPTMEMEPLNEAARALSKAEEPKWSHPIDSLPGNGGFADQLIDKFNRQIEALITKGNAQPAAPVPTSNIDPDAFAQLQAQVAELAAQNAALLEKAAQPTAARR